MIKVLNKSTFFSSIVILINCQCYNMQKTILKHRNFSLPKPSLRYDITCYEEIMKRFLFDSTTVQIYFKTPEMFDTIRDSNLYGYLPPHLMTNQSLSSWGAIIYEEDDFRLVNKVASVIIYATNINFMQKYLLENYPARNWNAGALFILTVTEETCDNIDCVMDLVLTLVKLFVGRFVIIVELEKKLSVIAATNVKNCFEEIRIRKLNFDCENFLKENSQIIDLNEKVLHFHALVNSTPAMDEAEKSYSIENENNTAEELIHSIADGKLSMETDQLINFRKCQISLRRNNNIKPYFELDSESQPRGISWEFLDVIVKKMKLNISAESPIHHSWCDWPAYTGVPFGAPKNNDPNGIVDPRNLTCLFPQSLGSFYSWNVLHYMFQDDLVLIITKEKEFYPIWYIIINIFSAHAWLIQACCLLGISTFWLIFELYNQKSDEQTKWNSSMVKIILSMYAVTLSFSIPFKSSLIKLRVLILVWLIYGLHFSVLFQSSYTLILSNPKKLKQVSKLNEVILRGMPIYGVSQSGGFIQDQIDIIKPNGTRFINFNIGLVNEYKVLLQKTGGAAILQSFFSAMSLLEDGYFDDKIKNDPVAYISDEKVVTKFRSLALTVKQHIYTREFNRLILLSHAAGISRKIFLDQFSHAIRLKSLKESASPRPLEIKDLKCPWFILSSGVLMSILIVIGEFFHFAVNNAYKKEN